MSKDGKRTVSTVTDFGVLLRLARKQADAMSLYCRNPTEDNRKKFEQARKEHHRYRALCLESDEMTVWRGKI